MGRRWELGRLASHISTMEHRYRPGRKKNHFWFVLKASTSQTWWNIVRIMLGPSRRSEDVCCTSYMDFNRNATQQASFCFPFLHSAPLLNKTTIKTVEKCCPIPYVSMGTNLAKKWYCEKGTKNDGSSFQSGLWKYFWPQQHLHSSSDQSLVNRASLPHKFCKLHQWGHRSC